MKPGFKWWILAHERPREGLVQRSVDIHSFDLERERKRHGKKAVWQKPAWWPFADALPVPFPSQFDELVIDDWLHLEQMDERQWWMDLGGFHLWVTIDGKGKPTVSHNGKPLGDYGLRADDERSG